MQAAARQPGFKYTVAGTMLQRMQQMVGWKEGGTDEGWASRQQRRQQKAAGGGGNTYRSALRPLLLLMHAFQPAALLLVPGARQGAVASGRQERAQIAADISAQVSSASFASVASLAILASLLHMVGCHVSCQRAAGCGP